MITEEALLSGERTFEEYKAWLLAMEKLFGPLQSLGIVGQDSQAILEAGVDQPKNKVRVELYEGAVPPPKEGEKLVCNGECMTEKKRKKVAAYRKT